MSRRGFLRALGITSASVLVPGLAATQCMGVGIAHNPYDLPSWPAPHGMHVHVTNIDGRNWYRYVDAQHLEGVGKFIVEIQSSQETSDLKVKLRLPDDGILSLTPEKVKA